MNFHLMIYLREELSGETNKKDKIFVENCPFMSNDVKGQFFFKNNKNCKNYPINSEVLRLVLCFCGQLRKKHCCNIYKKKFVLLN